ncbi:MAG: S-layer protein domain-containing protein [Candidatus Methanoperedens sp.]|nr:S-layer protein domain-containing protein [Candidatus Methanoperedens sp.]
MCKTNFAKMNKIALIFLTFGLLLFISGCVEQPKETVTPTATTPPNTPPKVATAASTPIPKETYEKTLAMGETWDIGGGWTLAANSIDAKASPKQVWITLFRNGIKLDDEIIGEGERYSYLNIFSTKIASVYAGSTSDTVSLTNTLVVDKKTLAMGETWDIGGGWTLTANSIDAKASPKQVWITLSRNGIKLDDKVVGEGETYYYNFLSTKIDSIYSDSTRDMVVLTEPLVRPDSKTLDMGETWDMGRGWTLTANSIDAKASPKQVWLTLYKNGVKLDDKVLSEGRTYNYNNIFSTKVTKISTAVSPAIDLVFLTDTRIADSPIPTSTPKIKTTPKTYSVTYYSGWLKQIGGQTIYFSQATNYNCEYGGVIPFPTTKELYICTIYGGPNSGTYANIYEWNADKE